MYNTWAVTATNATRATIRAVVVSALSVVLVAVPPVVAFAADPEQSSKISPKVEQTGAAQTAILRGRVTNEAGAPLANVRVRAAIPNADMRFVDSTTPHKQLESKSNTKGEYRLEIPEITKPTTISIDAMKPGYRRLVGTLMRGGDPKSVEVAPGTTAEASLVLKPALYFAGVVVDQQGRPISGVTISANLSFGGASGGIERTATNSDGSFELFNYDVKAVAPGGGASKGYVFFSQPDYIDTRIEDVYAITPKERDALRIVLETGHEVAGTVFDVAGRPVPNAMIKAVSQDSARRKSTTTDANGKFAMRGLGEGAATLSARALDIKQKVQMPIVVNGDQNELQVRLKVISLPAGLKKHTVLGMQLAEVTPQLKSAYDLYFEHGAVILDPGRDSDRLKIGRLGEGYCFWMAGNTRISSVRQFVSQILAEAAKQDAAKNAARGVRVVFSFSTVEGDGNNTQYMKLTNDDLKQLQTVLGQLPPERP